MSRWFDKWSGYPKRQVWRRYSPLPSGKRDIRPTVRGYLRTELTTYARSLIKLKKVGKQLEGACPLCTGKLIVGPARWRCLGCAVQEIHGQDLAGMREFLSRCPK